MAKHENQHQLEDELGITTTGSEQLAFEVDYPEETAGQRRWRRVRLYAGEAIKENQTVLPVIGAILGVLLAFGLSRVGASPDPDTWSITVESARNGLLSAISILFAALSIVLALASVTIQNVVSRFSLRMMRIYLRDAWDKVVIAIFAMAATFDLSLWYLLRGLPADALAPSGGVLLVALLLFVSGATMIWYLSALTGWFRLDRIMGHTSQAILNAARAIEREHRQDTLVAQSCFDSTPDGMPVRAHRSGYLTDVDTQGLYELALRHDLAIVIDQGLGRNVVQGEAIGWIEGDTRGSDEQSSDRLAELIDVTDVREMFRSPGYGIVVLVDIAIMALSPAVNDPNTAVQVLEAMAFLFPQLAQIRSGSFGRVDKDGRQRVAVRAFSFGDYVEMATTQIVLYGGDDPAVVVALQRLARVLYGLELHEHDRPAVDAFAAKVRRLTG